MGLEISGLGDLRANLGELRQAASDDATRQALRAAAALIRDEEQQIAPVLDDWTAQSTALPPRALKDGIEFRIRKDGPGFLTALIGPRKGTRRAAHLVEFGHRLIKGGRSHVGARGAEGSGREIGQVPAHPFLRPAFDSKWRPALALFAETLKLQLKKWVK